ncbi:MAG: peptidoglycan-binding protein [Candidatus Sulfotelmatobacter sp.]
MIGNACSSAACAALLACALVPAALASQTSNTPSTAPKKSAKTTTHHTTAKKSSRHSSTHKTSASTSTSSSTHTASARPHASRKGKRTLAKRPRGQQKIDSERAQEIQSALIREHYLSGDATGTWNQASEDAMRRYQNDHGWQTKEVPDSRALIKLGLGPSKDHLLNPESAMTSAPDTPKSASLPTTSQAPMPVSSTPGSTTTQPQK